MLDLYPSETKPDPHNASTTSSNSASESLSVKLPKLVPPQFHGDIMKWKIFWEHFQTAINDNSSLDDHECLTYLREAFKDPEAAPLLSRSTTTANRYQDIIEALKERYDQKRTIDQHHVSAIVDHPHLKQCTKAELRNLSDIIKHSISCMTDAKQYDAGTILTSIVTTKFPTSLNYFPSQLPKCPTSTWCWISLMSKSKLLRFQLP